MPPEPFTPPGRHPPLPTARCCSPSPPPGGPRSRPAAGKQRRLSVRAVGQAPSACMPPQPTQPRPSGGPAAPSASALEVNSWHAPLWLLLGHSCCRSCKESTLPQLQTTDDACDDAWGADGAASVCISLLCHLSKAHSTVCFSRLQAASADGSPIGISAMAAMFSSSARAQNFAALQVSHLQHTLLSCPLWSQWDRPRAHSTCKTAC